MNTSINLRNSVEVQREGIDALIQRLGKAGTMRFLQQFYKDGGDYTKERHAMCDNMSVDDIVADMKKWEENF